MQIYAKQSEVVVKNNNNIKHIQAGVDPLRFPLKISQIFKR